MKYALSLTAAALAVSLSHAVEPVYSDPVGFVKLGNTAADESTTPAVPANSEVVITVPLEAELAFSGTVLSADDTAGTIQVSGSPGWSADEWVSAGSHSAVISSGAENGLRAIVDSNSADTLTVTVTTPGDLDNLSAGDRVEIRKNWTIQSFFADSTVYDGCVLALYDETLTGLNHTRIRYTYFAGTWYLNLSVPSNDTVIHPGEMFRLTTAGSPIQKLTVFGDVPTSSHRVDLLKDGSGPEDLEIGLFKPVPTTIGGLGIPASNGDEIRWFDNLDVEVNKGSSETFTYFNGRWYQNLAVDVTDTFTFDPGIGFLLRRNTGNAMETLEWLNP